MITSNYFSRKSLKLATLLLSGLLGFTSCTFNESKTDESSTDASQQFSPEVKAIVSGVCVKCHDGTNAQGKVAYMNDAGKLLAATGSNGMAYIKPGDPDNSLLYLKISSDSPPVGERMPFGQGPLSDAQISAVRSWILALSPNVTITTPALSSNVNARDNPTTYAVSGTCNLANAPVTLSINSADAGSGICDGTNFSATVNVTFFTTGSNSIVASMSSANKTVTSTATFNWVALAVAITAPTSGSTISNITNSSTYAISGTCTSTNGNIGIKIINASNVSPGVALTTTPSPLVCNGSTFSGTIDTTASPFVGSSSAAGSNDLTATITDALSDNTASSATVTVTKDLRAPSIAITSPAKPTGLRAAGADSTDTTYINNATANRTTFPVTGTCTGAFAVGGTVTVKRDGVAVGTAPCTGTAPNGTFAASIDVTTAGGWSDGDHALSASIVDTASMTASTANSVAMYSWQAAPTIHWSTDIAPMLLTPIDAATNSISTANSNPTTCVECHFRNYHSAGSVFQDGNAKFTFGYWNDCAANGGYPGIGAYPVCGAVKSATPVGGGTTFTTTVGNTNVVGASALVGVFTGMLVTGTGIPTDTFVAAVSSPNFTLSKAATASNPGLTLSFATLTQATFPGTLAVTTVTTVTTSNTVSTTKTFTQVTDAACSTTLNSPTVTTTNSYTTEGVIVGMEVSGTGILPGTYVTAVASATSLTLSQLATATGTASLTFKTNLAPGMRVSGIGIPAGTTIDTITDATHMNLSQAANANGTVTLTFTTKADAYRTPSNFNFQFGYFDNPCTPAIAPLDATGIASGVVTVSAGIANVVVGMKVVSSSITVTGGSVSQPPIISTAPTYKTVASIDVAHNQFTLSDTSIISASAQKISFFPSTLNVNCNSTSVADTFSDLISANMDNYRKGTSIVNAESAATRNKIVRGNPSQSMLYNKIIDSGTPGTPHLMTDTYIPKTGLVNAVPGTAATAQMPYFLPQYFSTSNKGKLYQWIIEGARTDN